MIPQRMTKSSTFRIKTQPSTTQLLNQKSKYHRYDTSLYHKTNYHLKPLKQNPQLFTKVQIVSVSNKLKLQAEKLQRFSQNKIKKEQDQTKIKSNQNRKETNASYANLSSKQTYVAVPQSMSIRAQLTKMAGLEKSLEKLLQQQTVMLVTAKKWIIFDIFSNNTIKGYKHKKQHDVASLTKILTFYTAYMIIKQYFLSIDRLQMMIDAHDQNIGGTKIQIKDQYLITLQDLLYAMMLQSANNASTAIANNLGSLVTKKKQGKYFSCFDLPNENKQQNMAVFVQLMNSYANQIGLTNSTFLNAHGMCKNKSSARDIAILTSQCYKIPLFSKIVNTKHYTLSAKYISNNGQQKIKQIPMTNTNKLLWLNSGCIGGKTGCNNIGGQSLTACYEGGIVIVVLGCAGREEKFADAEKLMGWLGKKLKIGA